MLIFSESSLTFKSFPFPPSINAAYSSFVRNGKLIRCKSPQYVAFNKVFKEYEDVLGYDTPKAQDLIKRWFKFHSRTVLNIECVFYDSRCFNKDGTIKKSDVFNRVKITHDKIADLLDIDDRFFWSGNTIRVPSKEHYVDITVSPSQYL